MNTTIVMSHFLPKCYLLLAIILNFSILSCTDFGDNWGEIYAEGGENTIVVEGLIEAGKPPKVLLSRSLVVESKNYYRNIANIDTFIVRNAEVYVSDGTQDYRLLFATDSTSTIGYSYSTTEIKGEAGRTYKLTILADGQEITAETTICANAPQATIETKLNNDGTYNIVANIQTLEHQPLCFFTRTAPDLFYLPAFWGVAIGSGKRNIYMGESIVSKADWRLYYNVGDTIDIKIATIDNLSYNIFYGYARNLSFSRNFLFPYNYNSPSNLSSGLGYWCGLNACEERVTISY